MIDIWTGLAIWALMTVLLVVNAGGLVRSARSGSGKHAFLDRWDVVAHSAILFLLVAVTLLLMVWTVVPPALWFVNAAASAVGLAAVAARWPDLPWRADDDKSRTRVRSALFNSALTVGAVLFLTV
ncbi:hypothetical protein [Nocardiopsis nanhaiensis]